MADGDSVNKIRFHYLSGVPGFRHRRLLQRFMTRIFRAEKRQLRFLDVVFCSDQYLLNINRQFLSHDTYTDIVTFDLSASQHGPTTAEIYVSVDRVRENALTYKTSWPDELRRVLFHGILHLCGYGDKSRGEKSVMRLKEDHYLNQYDRYVSRETRST